MNLGTAKNKVLMLMDVYSKNGIIQDPNGTKLKNYSYKMNPFFDTTQKQIATIKKIETLVTIDEAPETETNYFEVDTPSNCYQIEYIENEEGRVNWKRKGKFKILISNQTIFPIDIIYFAYPATIGSTTLDTYDFEIDTEAQEAMPLYVASQLLLNENNAIGDRLLAQYNNMLANLNTSTPTNGASTVTNSLFTKYGATQKLF